MRTIERLPISLLLLIAVAAHPAFAQSSWLPNGNPVCAAAGNQTAPVAIADAANGMYVAWLDARPVAPGIYAQRLLPGGVPAPGFPPDGVLLSGVSGVTEPRIIPDGAGGALVLWVTGTAVRAQRLDANGSLHAGWPGDGRAVATTNINRTSMFDAVTDGAGGAYFTRLLETPSPFGPVPIRTIYLSRIDSEGNVVPSWTASGKVLQSSEISVLYDLVPNVSNGLLTGSTYWIEPGTNPHVGIADRWFGDGTRAYAFACPNPFTGFATDGVYHMAGAADGIGGAYWTYKAVNGQGTFYWGQHLNAGGAKLWPDFTVVPFSELTVQDGASGVWFVGRPPGLNRLEVHRRLANGTTPAGWTAAGVVISNPTALGVVRAEPFPDVVVVLCWSENTAGGGFDIRATSVRQDAIIPPGWDPGGSAVCTATGDQVTPTLVLQGASALAAWEDRRNGAGNSDIYANRIEPVAPAAVLPAPGSGFGILSIGPVPARERVEVAFAAEHDRPATFEIVDVAGRLIERTDVAPASGRHIIGLQGLSTGVYLVRLKQGARVATARVAVVH